MNYIQNAYKGLFDWWRYLVGSIIIFIAWQIIGGIPLIVAIFWKAGFKNIASGNTPLDLSGMVELLGNNLFLFLMLLSFVIGFLGLLFSSKLLHKLSFKDLTTTRRKIDWSRFWFIFILWGVLSTGLTVADYYMTPEDYVVNINWEKFAVLAVIAILFIPIQTSFEEYFFRGYLMQGFGVIFKNKWAPLLITSVGFGLLHLANPEVETLGPMIMVFYIGTGLFFGITTLMDEGTELALGLHAANNIFAAFLVTTDWTVFQTDALFIDTSEPSVTWEMFVPVIVLYPVMLYLFSRKYNWSDWGNKLAGKIDPPVISQDDMLS